MASPGILDIQFSKVGSVDSNYYGVNVLDSASLLIDEDADIKKSYSVDENVYTFPNADLYINIKEDTNPLSITAALTNGSILSFGGAEAFSGGGGGGGVSQAQLDSANALVDSANALIVSLRSELESAGTTGERWE